MTDTLEDAMSKVLAALAQNHAETGEDTWKGKPEQEPLPMKFNMGGGHENELPPEIEMVSPDPADELNSLMSTYVTAAAALRKSARSADEEDEDADSVPAARPPEAVAYDQMSMAELLAQLDEVTV